MIGRLEAAVAGERMQLEASRTALAVERERLAEGRRLFEARVAAARAVNENERRALEEEREALEGIRTEVVQEQEEATRLAETSRKQAAEALARERQV